MLLCPRSKTFPAFDAFMCVKGDWWCLQITVNKSKPLSAKLLLAFFNDHPAIPKRWLGVVPPQMARRQQRFSISVDDEAKSKKSKTKNREQLKLKNIDQYVMPFPVQDENWTGFSDDDQLVLVMMRIKVFQHFCKSESHSRGHALVSMDTS
jgi:hypothetical protein